MPRISEFYGITIEVYFVDHPPPHVHARYSGDEALVVIETGEVFAGSLPVGRFGSCEIGWMSTGPKSWQTGIVRALANLLNPWNR